MKKFTLDEFRCLLSKNEEEAISILNDIFINQKIDVSKLKEVIGFSWSGIQPELEALGYQKQRGKGKGLVKIENKGVKEMTKESKMKLTEEEILFIKELYSKKNTTDEELDIKIYDEYKQRSFLISEELYNRLLKIYEENKKYRKQDIFNEILRKGIDSFKK